MVSTRKIAIATLLIVFASFAICEEAAATAAKNYCDDGDCVTCAKATDDFQCTDCANGKYHQAFSGEDSLTVCKAPTTNVPGCAKYSSATACAWCEEGKFLDTNGDCVTGTAIANCIDGRKASGGELTCDKCKGGKVPDLTAASEKESCVDISSGTGDDSDCEIYETTGSSGSLAA